MKVQDVVRSMPWVKWNRGCSVCYNDTSYTRTHRRVRFKFEYLTTSLVNDGFGHYDTYEAALTTALEAAGHTVAQVQVLKNYVCIWQAFPIQIVEQAVV